MSAEHSGTMETRLELREGLDGLDASAWDALVGGDDPFVEYAFLRALETSGSVGEEAGWRPIHVTAWRGDRLVGALPLYEKDHSWGEYIFDFAWARAANQLRIPYYPKLVSMTPFTPATGRRFLVADDVDHAETVGQLIVGARAAAEEVDASSIHLLFLTREERELACAAGMRPRLSTQFHWDNDGYESFDDYLARFRSSKRKQIRKERRTVAESGLDVRLVAGPDLSDADWRAMRRFYQENCLSHGQHPYLRPAFFEEIRRKHADRVLVGLAYEGKEPVAVSINFHKGAHLYGRYWGCRSTHDFLHFELCYYRLIEHAIARGLRHFEAGAQGFHKLKRGLLPAEIHSAHWVREPRLARAVNEYLPSEAFAVKAEIAALNERSPFHRR